MRAAKGTFLWRRQGVGSGVNTAIQLRGQGVNHYPKHIGDWMTATAHLSEVEECIYSRMMDQYYAREAPLPLDQAACCRLVRASTASARKAVPVMLREFFTERADGWHQKRCDEELTRFSERSEAARASAAFSVEARRRKANVERTLSERSNERSANVTTNVELASSHKPQANSQEPEPLAAQPSVASLQSTPRSKALRPPSAKTPLGEAPTGLVWSAYATAYFDVYGSEPVRNAMVNGQLANFVSRIGKDEAPAVAASYLRSKNARYVAAGHSVGMLVQDAEKLRTEWANGKAMTATEAKRIDRGSESNPFLAMLKEGQGGTA